MKELLEAQKVILKLKTQEAVKLFEHEKRKLKRQHKIDMVFNAFACGLCFAFAVIAVRDGAYLLACVQLFGSAYMAWRLKMEWELV
jgi:hypothetical protein